MNPQRVTIISLFHAEIANRFAEKWAILQKEYRESIVRKLERSCFNESLRICERDGVLRKFGNTKFDNRYSGLCYKIITNLINEDSHMFDSIISGLLIADNIATYPQHVLCPSYSAEERRQIDIRKNVHLEQKYSTAYTCRKCFASKTTSIPVQTRCADEASNTSIKCMNCEATWTI